jgi:alpha-beta hydrolase superfamily lysophospholipase
MLLESSCCAADRVQRAHFAADHRVRPDFEPAPATVVYDPRAMLAATVRLLLRTLGSALLGMAVLAVGLWLHYLFSGPAPQVWHRTKLGEEFTVARAAQIRSVADYRRLEDRLFEQLRREVYAQVPPGSVQPFNRYAAGSRSDPGVWPVDWNRTFEFTPAAPVGGVLLLHGLTDSPYSMRSLGTGLASRGFRAVGLRLPGHGTAPSGLLTFEIEDMEAAVRMAMLDLRAQLGPDKPIYVIGYSNGAALAVDYALSVLEGQPLPRPAGLVLLSPEIEIARIAAIGRIQTGLSELPGFGRAAWSDLQPELDPFKYQSFSLHAGGQVARLTRRSAARLDALAKAGPVKGFPPVLVFLSTVDSTVHADAVVRAFLGKLAPERHELVLFDVNRFAPVQGLLVDDPGPLTQQLLAMPQRPFTLTVITNVDARTREVREMRALPGSDRQTQRPLGLEWPLQVFSLSHVALPFPPDDPLYGYEAVKGPLETNHVQLGEVQVRGENGVLNVPAWMLTRQRSNPFYAYVQARVDEFVVGR